MSFESLRIIAATCWVGFGLAAWLIYTLRIIQNRAWEQEGWWLLPTWVYSIILLIVLGPIGLVNILFPNIISSSLNYPEQIIESVTTDNIMREHVRRGKLEFEGKLYRIEEIKEDRSKTLIEPSNLHSGGD